MSEKTYTEREVVLRERKAYENGILRVAAQEFCHPNALDALRASAADRFPIPKVTRPRVVKDADGVRWRMVGGVLHFRSLDAWHTMLGGGDAHSTSGLYGTAFMPTPQRIALWAELLANPTEEVEADE